MKNEREDGKHTIAQAFVTAKVTESFTQPHPLRSDPRGPHDCNSARTMSRRTTTPPNAGWNSPAMTPQATISRPARIAILADLVEPVGPDATTEVAATAYEIVRAIGRWAATNAVATVDLFARRGSWSELPLVSVDPDEIGPVPDEPLAWFAVQEAVYGQLWSRGMLAGYDLVHSVGGIVTPLPFLAAEGKPVLQTLLNSLDHPACWLLPRLLPEKVARVAVEGSTAAALEIPVVNACADLSRFVPSDVRARHLVWDGTGGQDAARVAAAIGARLGYPVRTVGDTEPVAMLQQAVALLHLPTTASCCGAPWALRALACGIPVAGWKNSLHGLGLEPDCGVVVPVGEWKLLADGIRHLPVSGDAARRRREVVLARHGPTAIVAKYRAIYHKLLEQH
jgi:hypothetical protein